MSKSQVLRFAFYPRPLGGGRPLAIELFTHGSLFLSTPSGWRATEAPFELYTLDPNFYPRPPGGGRPLKEEIKMAFTRFLSTPSGWRATVGNSCTIASTIFLSTPSGWRATRQLARLPVRCAISIHALRVEGDPHKRLMYQSHFVFLSTPSGWRATRGARDKRDSVRISIHALRVEGDPCVDRFISPVTPYFYPRPPGGGRHFYF